MGPAEEGVGKLGRRGCVVAVCRQLSLANARRGQPSVHAEVEQLPASDDHPHTPPAPAPYPRKPVRKITHSMTSGESASMPVRFWLDDVGVGLNRG